MSGPASMACRGVGELERALRSGTIDGALREHLGVCDACRQRERDVRENLRFMDEMGAVMREPKLGLPSPGPRGLDGVELPGYRVVREIARGGQGTVLEGVQIETKRRVAIKVIDPAGGSPNAQRRIEREAAIAAALRHPSIVTIYDSAPLPDGRHALAMEYVEGPRLDEWARSIDAGAGDDPALGRGAVRAKVRAMVQVCDAVEHAHLHGVIHRDLKPANVIMGEGGLPRVVDFGIARRLAKGDSITRPGAFAGTLAYASPEQVSGGHEGVDIRSDVYSLGVMLYEVLTGRRPYETDGSLTGAIANITNRAPQALGELSPGGLPAGSELESIVAKALAKTRETRYQTAGLLKDDLRNWLAGRAVDARKHSTFYVLRKTAARHRFAFVIAGAAFVVLAVLAGSMAWSARRLERQRILLAESLSASNIERARLLAIGGSAARAEELVWPELVRCGADPSDPQLGFASSPEATQGAWALYELFSRHPNLARMPLGVKPVGVGFESGGGSVLVTGTDLSQRAVALPDGSPATRTRGGDENTLGRVYTEADQRCVVVSEPKGVRVHMLATGGSRFLEDERLAGPLRLAVNAEGTRLVSIMPDGPGYLWQVEPLRLLTRLGERFTPSSQASFSRDGRHVTFGLGQDVLVVRAEDGGIAARWSVPDDLWISSVRPAISFVQLSPDGSLVGAGFNDRVLVFDGRSIGSPPIWSGGHSGFINSLAFSVDSRVLLSSGHERTYKTWDARSGALMGVREQSVPSPCPPAISSDGSRAATCDGQGVLQVWESRPRGWLTRLEGAQNSIHAVRFSADGESVFAACADGTVRAWRARDRTPLWIADGGGLAQTALCVSGDGARVAAADSEGTVRAWDARTGAPAGEIARFSDRTTWIAYSPDGASLAAASSDLSIHIRGLGRDAPTREFSGHTVRVIEGAFSRDGRTLVSVGQDGVGIVWDVESGSARARLVGHVAAVRAVAISPDEMQVATGSDDWTIRLWDVRTGVCTRVIKEVKQHVFGLAYHPSGNLLFSCCRDPAVQVWDVRTGRELAKLDGHEGIVMSLALSPDGRRLATGSVDRTVGVWDLAYYQTHLRGNAAAWSASRAPASR